MTRSTDSHRKLPVTRRRFLRAAALATAAATTTSARARDSSEKLGVGFIGVGGRGSTHLGTVRGLIQEGENASIAAVCDAYSPRLRQRAKENNCRAYRSYRDLLADRDVDVVCIATPDRLHLPQAIDAVRAGKDVDETGLPCPRMVPVESEPSAFLPVLDSRRCLWTRSRR